MNFRKKYADIWNDKEELFLQIARWDKIASNIEDNEKNIQYVAAYLSRQMGVIF